MFSGIIESVGTLCEFVHGQESAVAVVETDTNLSLIHISEPTRPY